MPERWQAGHIFSASQMPDGGKLIAASCSDGALRTWSLDCSHSTLEPHSISRPHALGMGSCCAWDLDGHCVASLATDGTLALLVSPGVWMQGLTLYPSLKRLVWTTCRTFNAKCHRQAGQSRHQRGLLVKQCHLRRSLRDESKQIF